MLENLLEYYRKSVGAKRTRGRNGESSFARAPEDKEGEGEMKKCESEKTERTKVTTRLMQL